MRGIAGFWLPVNRRFNLPALSGLLRIYRFSVATLGNSISFVFGGKVKFTEEAEPLRPE